MEHGLRYIADRFVSTKAEKLIDLVVNKSFNIPHHQRDYSWGKTEVDTFLKDVEKLRVQDFETVTSLPHFIGAMVFIKNQNNGSFEIIDGQQRLTTTMLYFAMLKLIANKLTNHNDITTVNTRIHQYLFSSLAGQPIITRLTLDRAQSFYASILSKSTISDISLYYNNLQVKKDVEKNIYHICIYIHKHFTENLEQFFDNNDELYKYIMQYIEAVQTMMISIEINVHQPGVAYTIFETLNARGKELSAANLIKNTLLSFAERQQTQHSVLQTWSNIIEEITQFDNVEITDFLTNSYLSRYGKLEDNLFNGIKKMFEETQISASDYATDINNDHLPYLKLKLLNHTQDNYFNQTVFDKLDELNNFIKVTRVYPLLLTGRAHLNNVDFEKLVISLVNFSFRYIVVINKSADSLLNLIISWSDRLREGTININNIKDEMKENAPDGEFKIAFETFAPGTQYQRFYIIKKIEDKLAGGQGITVLNQSHNQHLEHIMPQRPNTIDWPHLYTDITNEVLDEKFMSYINRIGNITVLERDINGHIKNKNFSYKDSNQTDKDYQHSVLKLPSKIKDSLSSGRWGFTSIDIRGRELSLKAVDVWFL